MASKELLSWRMVWIGEGMASGSGATKNPHLARERSGYAYLNRFTPRDKDTAGGLN